MEIYPGQYYDAETGLHYNYHRYYDPHTGRYLTPDPIGLAGGINLYAYAGLNPINYLDFYGLSIEQIIEAYEWIDDNVPDLSDQVDDPTFFDVVIPGRFDGAALPFEIILVDTEQINNDPVVEKTHGAQAEIVRVVAHELLHAKDGFLGNQINMIKDEKAHDKIHQESILIMEKYIEEQQKNDEK